VTTLPSLSGKLAGEVAAFLDIVGYYYMKPVEEDGQLKDKRLMLVAKTETIIAKDRTNALPMVIEEPTMQKIFDYINGKTAAKKAS
jgi:cell division septum initiation protein DivIVA